MEINWKAVAESYAHPTALLLLNELMLADGPLSPSSLATSLKTEYPKLSMGTVSYHMRELAKRELIECVSTEPRRGALEHFYAPTQLATALHLEAAA